MGRADVVVLDVVAFVVLVPLRAVVVFAVPTSNVCVGEDEEVLLSDVDVEADSAAVLLPVAMAEETSVMVA